MLFGYFSFQNDSYIKKINIDRDLSDQIDSMFTEQRNEFFYDEDTEYEIRDFYPGDPSTESYISKMDYDDPDGMLVSVEKSIVLPYMDPAVDLQNLVAIFKRSSNQTNEILIQLIDRKHTILPKSSWLIFKNVWDGNLKKAVGLTLDSNSNGCFCAMNESGLQLDNKITAVMRPGILLFKSYYQANRIFDLGDNLAAATNETINQFLSLDIISEKGNPKANINCWKHAQRRKVSKVMALGFVNKFSGNEIYSRAKKAKKQLNIELDEGRIVIPDKPSDLAALLQFLSNGVMASYLDDECDYEVGSMRPAK